MDGLFEMEPQGQLAKDVRTNVWCGFLFSLLWPSTLCFTLPFRAGSQTATKLESKTRVPGVKLEKHEPKGPEQLHFQERTPPDLISFILILWPMGCLRGRSHLRSKKVQPFNLHLWWVILSGDSTKTQTLPALFQIVHDTFLLSTNFLSITYSYPWKH